MTKPFHLDRRQFLVLSSVGTVGVAAFGGSDLFAATKNDLTLAPLLSVGYWDGVLSTIATVGSGGVFRNLDVDAAADLPTGDPSFLDGGAQLRVEGLFRSSRDNMSLALQAAFRPLEHPDATLPFSAWSYSGGGKYESKSAPSKFVVPVEPDSGLRLTLLRSAAVTPHRARPVAIGNEAELLGRKSNDVPSVIDFTINTDAGRPRLRRGTYFLALRSSADQKIDWSTIRIADPKRKENYKKGFLYQRGVLADQVVDFDYLAISVEHPPVEEKKAK